MNISASGRLKIFRKALELKQIELARIIGKNLSTLQRYENGSVGIDPAVVHLLTCSYRLNPQWLYTGTGDMFRPEKIKKEITRLPLYTENGFKNKYFDILTVFHGKTFDEEKMIAFHVPDDLMNPYAMKDDCVILYKEYKKTSNRIYLCKINNKYCLREIIFNPDSVNVYHYDHKVIYKKSTENFAPEDIEILGQEYLAIRYCYPQ